jgi:NAD(P)-dependent dehydrogenase (short-subunit alcohol dehydrogenase family)
MPGSSDDRRRVCLVTGARRGIGAAIAVGLAGSGTSVIVHHLDAADEAAVVVAACRARGADACAIEADLGSRDDLVRLVGQSIELVGPIDVLVNNAARASNVEWSEVTPEEWAATLQVNLTAPMLLAQACLPGMLERGFGRVINITSITAQIGGPSGIAYVAAKAGLAGLTRALARQAAGPGVTVNAVSPGAIQTENERELYGHEDAVELDVRTIERQAIARRLGPDDVVGVVSFLAGDASAAITGEELEVSGGWRLH